MCTEMFQVIVKFLTIEFKEVKVLKRTHFHAISDGQDILYQVVNGRGSEKPTLKDAFSRGSVAAYNHARENGTLVRFTSLPRSHKTRLTKQSDLQLSYLEDN